jgi:hypothetical protein
VWFEQHLVVPGDPELQKEIFDEAYLSKFSIHPRSTKMYLDLRKNFWWSNMKVDIPNMWQSVILAIESKPMLLQMLLAVRFTATV